MSLLFVKKTRKKIDVFNVPSKAKIILTVGPCYSLNPTLITLAFIRHNVKTKCIIQITIIYILDHKHASMHLKYRLKVKQHEMK